MPETDSTFGRVNDLLASQLGSQSSTREFLDHIGTPCVSVSVLQNGKTSWACFGRQPYNEETLFQACSISKPLTALAVIKLVQEEILDLDESITSYLSAEQLSLITTPDTASLVPLITLRQLLSHTSGLNNGGFRGYTSRAPTTLQTLAGIAPANNTQVYLVDLPGRKYSYSGGGFTVVQLILTTVLNKSFPDLMQEIVLEPLNMTRSFYGPKSSSEKNFAAAHYTAETPTDVEFHELPELAAAGLWTTPSDLLKAVTAIQMSLDHDVESTSDTFLSKHWAEAILTPSKASEGYGIGWKVHEDLLSWGHGGSNEPGYRCQLVGYNKGNGICVMTNSMYGTDAVTKVIWAIAHHQGWSDPYEKWPFHPLVNSRAVVDEQWKEWKGSWGTWEILGDAKPAIRSGNGPVMRLLPVAKPTSKEDGKEVLEVAIEGLQVVIRLKWKDGKRALEVDGELMYGEASKEAQT